MLSCEAVTAVVTVWVIAQTLILMEQIFSELNQQQVLYIIPYRAEFSSCFDRQADRDTRV